MVPLMSDPKPFVKKVNFQKQYLAVEKNTISLHPEFDNDNFRNSIEYAFYRGLKDARMWIDPYLHCSILRHFCDENPSQSMAQRRINIAMNSGYELYHAAAFEGDSLFFFNNGFGAGAYQLMDCLCNTKNWSFSNNFQEVFWRILEVFPSISGSLGDFYIKNILSNVYSSGLLCAKTKNSEDLFEKIIPIYKNYNGPIGTENKDEIADIVKNDLFLSLINEIEPLIYFKRDHFITIAPPKKEAIGRAEKEAKRFEEIDSLWKSKSHLFPMSDLNLKP